MDGEGNEVVFDKEKDEDALKVALSESLLRHSEHPSSDSSVPQSSGNSQEGNTGVDVDLSRDVSEEGIEALINSLIEEYGAIKEGENPVRNIKIPAWLSEDKIT